MQLHWKKGERKGGNKSFGLRGHQVTDSNAYHKDHEINIKQKKQFRAG